MINKCSALALVVVFGVCLFIPLQGSANSDGPSPALLNAANTGDVEAMVEVGDFYRSRNRDSADANLAYEFYAKAASNDSADAFMRMGWVFENGYGVPADIHVAVDWYEKASALGHHSAQFNLGLIYEFQRTSKNELWKAIELYEKAAQHEAYNLPQFRLGSMYEDGRGTAQDLKKAADWYFIAGSRGHTESQFRLGRILENDAKSRTQLEQALGWYKAAAQGGGEEAAKAAQRLEGRLTVERLASKQRADQLKAAQKPQSAQRPQSAKKPEVARKPTTPLTPPGGPVQEYKGYTLVGSVYKNANNEGFFKSIKWAIDEVKKLPVNLRKFPELIKEIRYDPPSKERARNDVYTNVVGVYTVGPDDTFPAPMIVYKDVRWGSPLQLAYSLAGNGVRAARHKERLGLEKRIKRHKSGDLKMSQAEFKNVERKHYELMASLTKSDLKVTEAYECKSLIHQFELTKIWETDSRRTDALARELSSRGCF